MRLLAALTALALLLPHTTQAQVSRIENGTPVCIAHEDGEICHHYFSGAEITVPAAFDDLYDGDCEGYRIRVIQPQSVLYAEPVDPVAIAPAVCATAAETQITLPKIKRETVFDIVVETQEKGGDWKTAHTVPVMVYPGTLLDPLKAWAAKGSLSVKDENGVLEAFLSEQDIEFNKDDYGTAETHMVTLMTGPVIADEHHKGGVIVFREKVYDLPQLRGTDTQNGPRVYVEMKLLDGLQNNPLVQKLFMDIFRMGHGMTAEREEYYDER